MKVNRWPALLLGAAILVIAAVVLRTALKATEVDLAEVERGDLLGDLAATGVVEGTRGRWGRR